MAHAPERIAAGRFLEEIGTLPCIVGGVGERSGEVVGELFSVFGAPIVQTTPVQAELAKIWTNILRYTMFALPNLLMMDCEQYDANVFEVIDLINRDYPRGGMPQPGFTAGTCLRKDFAFSEERSRAPGMLLAVSRVNESVPLFLVQGMIRRMGPLKGRKVAVLGLAFKAGTDDERDSLSHKLIRLLERELADVAVHDPHVTHADAVASRMRSSTRTQSSSPPTTPSSAGRRGCAGSRMVRATRRWSSTRGTASAPARSSRSPTRSARSRRAHEPRPGHRRSRHDRRRRRAAAAARPLVGGARVRPAPGAGLDARGLRGAHRRPARARAGARGDAAAART